MRAKLLVAIVGVVLLSAAGAWAQESIVDNVKKACATELTTYCSQVTPGEGRILACFFAHEDKFCVTPTYHVFAMYAAHQGAQSLRTEFSTPAQSYSRNGQPATLPGLAGSASIKGKQVMLTVTNQSLDQMRETQIALRGGTIKSVNAVTLVTDDVHAHNSFEMPNVVEPKTQAVSTQGSTLVHRFPPASVTKLEITLG